MAAAYVNTIFSRFYGKGEDFFPAFFGKVALNRTTFGRFKGNSEGHHKGLCFLARPANQKKGGKKFEKLWGLWYTFK